MNRYISAFIVLSLPALAQHTIHVTPSTVQWGFFAADAKPVVTVKSGETVTIDTICGIPEMLEQLGAAPLVAAALAATGGLATLVVVVGRYTPALAGECRAFVSALAGHTS